MNIRSANGSKIDGITVDQLIDRMVVSAVYSKDRSVEMRQKNESLISLGKDIESRGYFQEYLRMMSFATYVMHPLRDQISTRTHTETWEARQIVKDGRAWFLSKSAIDASCKDCGHRMWYHLGISTLKYLPNFGDKITAMCPFGREYWAIARLLDAESDIRRCRTIARATASQGAPVWRKPNQEIPF